MRYIALVLMALMVGCAGTVGVARVGPQPPTRSSEEATVEIYRRSKLEGTAVTIINGHTLLFEKWMGGEWVLVKAETWRDGRWVDTTEENIR